MSDEKVNIETVVDDLSKPENKAELEKSLNDAFKEATNSADDKTAAPDEGDQKDVSKDKKPEGDDPSKQKAGEDDKKPANRVEELLHDRNVAKTEAANKQTEVQALTKQISDLTKLVQDLQSGKGGERANSDDGEGTDDKPMTKKEIDAYLAKKEQEKAEVSNSTAAAEKSIADQIQALEADKDAPHAKDFIDLLKKGMQAHPTLSAYAVYCMYVGAGQIPGVEVARSNANRTGTSNRSKTNLLNTKNPADMTQAERLAFLKGAEKSNDLKGLI